MWNSQLSEHTREDGDVANGSASIAIELNTNLMDYYRDSPGNYCHFLLGNMLETFIFLKKSGNINSCISSISANNPSSEYGDFYRVFLSKLPAATDCRQLPLNVTPKPQTNWKDGEEHRVLKYLDDFVEFLCERLEIVPAEPNTITFIRRPIKPKARRAIVNELSLVKSLRKLAMRNGLDFEVVDLAGKSLTYQVHLMRRTKLLVGLHGAGLVNGIFCNRGSHVLEIRPHENFVHKKFRMLCEIQGVVYDSINSYYINIPSYFNIRHQVQKKKYFNIGNRYYRDRFILIKKKQIVARVQAILASQSAS